MPSLLSKMRGRPAMEGTSIGILAILQPALPGSLAVIDAKRDANMDKHG